MRNPTDLNGIDPDLRDEIKQRCRELRRNNTLAEKKLWQVIRNRQIQNVKFYRQAPLLVEDRETPQYYIVDFYCDKYRLALEIDGKIHEHRKEYDRWRSLLIQQYDVEIVRWKNDEIITHLPRVLMELSNIVKDRKAYLSNKH